MDAGKAVEAHAPGNVWLASIDGGRVVSCGADGAVCVYAVSDSSIVLEAKEVVHDAAIRAIAFDPKDSRLATVGEDRKTHVVSFPSLQDKRTALRSGVAARAAAFSTTGLLAIGGDDDVVSIIKLAGDQRTFTLKVTTPVLSVAFSADGSRLVVASSDGLVRIHKVEQASESLQEEFAEALFPKKSLSTAQGSCQVAFNSAGTTVAVAGGADVALLSKRSSGSWKQSRLQNAEAVGSTTQGVGFSSDGSMLAVSRGKTLEFWNVKIASLMHSCDAQKPISSILSPWNIDSPIVVADKGGGLTIFNLKMEAVVQDERLEVPAAAEDWHGAEEEEEYNPQVVAENLVGTEGNPDQEHDVAQSIENTIDLDHDEHDSKSPLRAPVRLHTSRKEISNEIAECQPAIHPGATPKNRTNRRFLAYNMVGCVITKEDVEDGVSHIEIEWWDHDFHRPIKFRDEYNFDMAAMGNEGVIFGGPPSPDGTHPSAIFYKPFDPWALKSDWTYYAANAIEEEFDAVAMGSGWVAASSSSKSAGQLLRIISLGGVQMHVISLSGAVVALAGSGNRLAVVQHHTAPVDASQIQMVTMYEVGTSMKKVFTEMLPLSPGEKLRWIGFSPFGVAALDTNHILRVYSESSSTWIPVFDGNSVKSSEDANEHFFIAGIDDRKVHCVHVRNARWPAVAPRPSVTGYPLAIPVLGKTSNSAADFDSELILERMRLTALRSQQEDPASVQRAITLFEKTLLTQLVSFAKNDSLVRALDLFDLLHLSKSRDIAIRMMQTLRMSALAERMYKSHQEKEVAEAAAQMAAASDVHTSGQPTSAHSHEGRLPEQDEDQEASSPPRRQGRTTSTKVAEKQQDEHVVHVDDSPSSSEDVAPEQLPKTESKPVDKEARPKARNPFAKLSAKQMPASEPAALGKKTTGEGTRKRQVTIADRPAKKQKS